MLFVEQRNVSMENVSDFEIFREASSRCVRVPDGNRRSDWNGKRKGNDRESIPDDSQNIDRLRDYGKSGSGHYAGR